MYGIVTVCCLFYCSTRSMVLAILEAEQRTILPEVSLERAINIQEHLMQFIRSLTRSMSLWFAVHNISFLILVLASAFWWQYMGVKEKDPQPALLFLSVSLACLAIAFKFLFPLWAASRVTKEWNHQIIVLTSCWTTSLEVDVASLSEGSLSPKVPLFSSLSWFHRSSPSFAIFIFPARNDSPAHVLSFVINIIEADQGLVVYSQRHTACTCFPFQSSAGPIHVVRACVLTRLSV